MANYFVDFSGSDGSGTFASPYNTIIGKTFAAGDLVWIRRQSKSFSAAQTFPTSGTFIGWPKSGDVYYDTRPSEAQSAWDGDTDDYATMYNSVSSGNCFNIASTQQHRIFFYNTAAAASIVGVAGNPYFYNCKFRIGNASTAVLSSNTYTISFYDSLFTIASGVSNKVLCCGTNVAGAAFQSYVYYFRCTVLCEYSATHLLSIGSGWHYFEDCVLDANTTTPATAYFHYAGTMTDGWVVYDNCTFKDKAGTTKIWDFGASNKPFSIRNCIFRTKSVYFSNIFGDCHLREYTQTEATDYALRVGWATRCVVDNATFSAGNTTCVIFYDWQNNCLIKNCQLNGNAACSWPTTSPQWNSSLYIQDDNNTVGNWAKYSQAGTIQASSVYRDGGETYSIKCQPTNRAETISWGLVLGDPGYETLFVEVTAGSRTLTLYGCYKNGTSPTKANVILETDYISSALDATRSTVSSYATDALSSDTSSWTGISGHTPFKVTLTFTAAQDCICPIRIRLPWYASGLEVYLDPKITVA